MLKPSWIRLHRPDFDTSRDIFPDEWRSGLLNGKALWSCRLDTRPQFLDTWIMEIDLTKSVLLPYQYVHVSARDPSKARRWLPRHPSAAGRECVESPQKTLRSPHCPPLRTGG